MNCSDRNSHDQNMIEKHEEKVFDREMEESAVKGFDPALEKPIQDILASSKTELKEQRKNAIEEAIEKNQSFEKQEEKRIREDKELEQENQ